MRIRKYKKLFKIFYDSSFFFSTFCDVKKEQIAVFLRFFSETYKWMFSDSVKPTDTELPISRSHGDVYNICYLVDQSQA